VFLLFILSECNSYRGVRVFAYMGCKYSLDVVIIIVYQQGLQMLLNVVICNETGFIFMPRDLCS